MNAVGHPPMVVDAQTFERMGNVIHEGSDRPTSELTEALRKGNEDAFREFFTCYFHRLLAYLLVLTRGQEEQAREALQLTLVRVARHVRRFETEDAFWSWLTVLARSSLIDEERKRKRFFSFLTRLFESQQVTQVEDDREDIGALLQEGIHRLEADEQILIERKYFKGESVKKIGSDLQISEKTVESKLVRIRRKLKQEILKRLQQ